jgi:hypothetical protein
MVRCISAFINACYIARRNALNAPALQHFTDFVRQFHELRNIFIQTGVRTDISLPRQHALSHYAFLIRLFGSPNGLCSSITESKHIKAVKEPWRRSSRFKALVQMLCAIIRMEKMAALRRTFNRLGMLTTSLVSDVMESHAKSGVRSDESDSDAGSSFDSYNSESESSDMLTDTPGNIIAATAGTHDASADETGEEMESVNEEKSSLAGAISDVKLTSTRRA